MASPVRLQLSRAKGFKLQDASLAANGLPAVNVARPSRWGNPYRVGTPGIPDAATAVRLYRVAAAHPYTAQIVRKELAGKNLACWCATGEPCHADVLLELANEVKG